MAPTILILGATGNTGKALAERLYPANKGADLVIVYRKGGTKPDPKYPNTVGFDWNDTSTYGDLFPTGHTIKTVYVLFPIIYFDTLKLFKALVAANKGAPVTRFVVLSGTPMNSGSPPVGDVEKYIINELKPKEYVILRPTGFFTLFAEGAYLSSIRDLNYFASGTKNGRIPLVAVDDIGDVAYKAVTAPAGDPFLNKEQFIFGPELFTYSEVAVLLSGADVLNRKIIHIDLDDKQALALFNNVYRGNPEQKQLAPFWKGADDFQAKGGEEDLYKKVPKDQRTDGKRKLKDYLVANKARWVIQ
ncbi:hypothetical protein H0H87_008027 [Tephrocybe sp. NHM501043]|nr:hypothetical protein H0H87_008027 [Tephrocybe sp. NHM501043]